jgi:deoxyribodipyrimidine photo-lyase
LPTAVYNYYNLDPQWLDDQDINRIMLWEPEVFEQYPIGQKAVDFAMALGENIPNLQHFVGSFNALEANLGASKIHYKEHPLNTDYRGTEHPRDWMTSVQGTHRSFFAFWKKAEKELRF